MWCLDFLEELDKQAERNAGEKTVGPSYAEGFKHIWRQRFIHLHPDVVEIAVETEWSQMKLNEETGWYERTIPDCWEDAPNFYTDEYQKTLRENR